MAYDRWVITTWGRTGSMALGEQLFNHLTDIRRGPIQWLHNERTGGYVIPTPWTLIHSHSLEQLHYIKDINTGVVYAIRSPSDAGLSMLICYSLSSWHLHTEKSLNEKRKRLSDPGFEDRWHIYNRELKENDRRINSKPLQVNLNDLNDYRNQCIDWNNTAVEILASLEKPIIIINYNDWLGDLEKSAKILNISHNENIELSVLPTIKSLSEQIFNYDEVLDWIQSHSAEDLDFIERWADIPLINSIRTCP